MSLQNFIKNQWLWAAILALSTIAIYLHQLGMLPLMADEGIRGTVAFEMLHRNNWIVPTVAGEYYYKKPPLYNWIMMLFFKASGDYSEWMLRLPAVLSLFGFGATIFYMGKKHFNAAAAFIAAMGFLLCGRMLIYDSFLGHIDIFYSWITFLAFYSLYHFSQKSQWLFLFLVSYLLTAFGVLMKGLPSFLFQGLSLVAWFIYIKKWRMLFNWRHLVGIGLFVVVAGSYFLSYHLQNSLVDYFYFLFDQAAQRTVVEKHWSQGLINLITFPFENIGHLFPTSIFVIYIIGINRVVQLWKTHDFVRFLILIFIVNIPPYWLSPGYYPRYLFMLYPLFFLVVGYAFVKFYEQSKWQNLSFRILIMILFSAIPLALFYAFFKFDLAFINQAYLKAILLGLVALLLAVVAIRVKQIPHLPLLLFASLLLIRLGFNWFVMPYRSLEQEPNKLALQKMHCKNIANISGNKPVYILDNYSFTEEMTYYIGTAKNDILRKTKQLQEADAFYLVLPQQVENQHYTKHYTFTLRWKEREVWLVTFN